MLEAIADGAKIAHEQRVDIEKLQARVRELEAELDAKHAQLVKVADRLGELASERSRMRQASSYFDMLCSMRDELRAAVADVEADPQYNRFRERVKEALR